MKIKKKTKKDKPIFWHNLFYETVYRLADTPLPEITFASALILARWWLNSDFSYPNELVIPIVMFGLLGSVIFYIYRIFFGKGSAAHMASILLLYGFYGYSYIHDSFLGSHFLKIIPSKLRTELTSSVFLAVLMALLAGAVAWLLRTLIHRHKTLSNFQPYKILLFAVVFLFAIQFIRCGERYLSIRKELSYHYPSENLPKPTSPSNQAKPDIYYLLFDRYTNSDVLKTNFNYDNSDFLNFLSSQGFINRQPAYSNYPFTTPSVSSTMAMNYLAPLKNTFGNDGEWQTLFPYRSILNDPPIAQTLKQNGYSYNKLSSWWDFTRLRVKADSSPTKSFRLNVLGMHFYLSDVQRDILHKSILSPWFKKGISFGHWPALTYDLDRNPQENFNAQMSSLKTIASRSNKSQPNFTFAHVLAPHPPYVFDQNGNWPSYDNEANDNGVDEKTKYTKELTYINKRIKDTVSYIRQQSPNAIVFIQADEGPYPKQFRGDITADHNYNPINLPISDMKQKFGIMASYYMPGINPSEVKNINASVDTFRFILNHYLGYSLPMLPDCQFAMGNKFSVYDYQLVTGKLKSQSTPASCSSYE
jgi:hypothetical protein